MGGKPSLLFFKIKIYINQILATLDNLLKGIDKYITWNMVLGSIDRWIRLIACHWLSINNNTNLTDLCSIVAVET